MSDAQLFLEIIDLVPHVFRHGHSRGSLNPCLLRLAPLLDQLSPCLGQLDFRETLVSSPSHENGFTSRGSVGPSSCVLMRGRDQAKHQRRQHERLQPWSGQLFCEPRQPAHHRERFSPRLAASHRALMMLMPLACIHTPMIMSATHHQCFTAHWAASMTGMTIDLAAGTHPSVS